MIYYADHSIEHRRAVQIIPFAVVKTKCRAVGVRSVNVQYATRRINRVYSASVLKFNPGQSGRVAGSERPSNQLSGLHAVLDDCRADTGSLDRDPFFNL